MSTSRILAMSWALVALVGCATSPPSAVPEPAIDSLAAQLCAAWLEDHIAGREPAMAHDGQRPRFAEVILREQVVDRYVILGADFARLDPALGDVGFSPGVATRDAEAGTVHCRGQLTAREVAPAAGTSWWVEHAVVLDLVRGDPPAATSLSVVPLEERDADGRHLTRRRVGCSPRHDGVSLCLLEFELRDPGLTDEVILGLQVAFFDAQDRLLDAAEVDPRSIGQLPTPGAASLENPRLLDLGLAAPVFAFDLVGRTHSSTPRCHTELHDAMTFGYTLHAGREARRVFAIRTRDRARDSSAPADCDVTDGVTRKLEIVRVPGAPSRIEVSVVRSGQPDVAVGTREVHAADASGRFVLVEALEPATP